jgi:hypothetical protein
MIVMIFIDQAIIKISILSHLNNLEELQSISIRKKNRHADYRWMFQS